ncbi:MAG: hypothetical protein AAGF47_06420 [Planctomycetota bacterium]
MSARRRSRRPRPARAAFGWLAAFGGAMLVGCAGPAEPEIQVQAASADRFDDLARPAVRGGTNGLELRTWSIEGQADLVRALVHVYGRVPTPMPDSVREAWIDSGLWVLRVPIEDLAVIRERMELIGPEQRDWFGQVPMWSEAVRGRRVRPGGVLSLADGPMRSSGGVLRLLTRGWTVPGVRGWDAALHVELAVQLADDQAPLLGLGGAQSELETGLVFPRLRTAVEMQRDAALLIVPIGGEASDAAAGRSSEGSVSEGNAAVGPAFVGPPAPMPPTLGEAMLTAAVDPSDPASARRRAIVVIVPRVPAVFPAVLGN